MPTILVTGANGQLGRELNDQNNQYPHHHFLFTGREELDITNENAIRTFFQKNEIDYCINCAAYTAVDKAESEEEAAYLANASGVQWLAEECAKQGAFLLHVSTDYVYHNEQNTPFKETDPTSPKGVYAASKLKGEQLAQAANSSTLIVRTSWVYSSYGNNFVKTMVRLGRERDSLNIVFDQIGTPTYAYDLADGLLQVIDYLEKHQAEKTTLTGIYHYSNEGITSWYDFAKTIFNIENIECTVSPIESVQYPTPANRPHFSALNKGKIKTTFGITIPHWAESLEKCLERLEA